MLNRIFNIYLFTNVNIALNKTHLFSGKEYIPSFDCGNWFMSDAILQWCAMDLNVVAFWEEMYTDASSEPEAGGPIDWMMLPSSSGRLLKALDLYYISNDQCDKSSKFQTTVIYSLRQKFSKKGLEWEIIVQWSSLNQKPLKTYVVCIQIRFGAIRCICHRKPRVNAFAKNDTQKH